MGVWARYYTEPHHAQDESWAEQVLVSARRAIDTYFKHTRYTWMAVGFPVKVEYYYILDVYCGGEDEMEWSQDEQLVDWPKSLKGLSGIPALNGFSGGTHRWAMSRLR